MQIYSNNEFYKKSNYKYDTNYANGLFNSNLIQDALANTLCLNTIILIINL